MGSYFPLCGEKMGVTDQVVAQLQQKCGSRVECRHALMLRREAHRLAFMLECGAYRLALKLKREATHARVQMLKRDPEACVSKNSTTIAFGTERDPCIVLLMKSAFEIGTRLWLRSTFVVGCWTG